MSSNSSIVPTVDSYLSTICSSDPCTNTTLTSVADSIIQGCASDLTKFGVDNQTVRDMIDLYPLAREVVCLKTEDPESLNNATIPLDSTAYNTTNGTFCVTELLTDLSGYIGANLTTKYIETVVLGGNGSALQILEHVPIEAICTDCIFAAIDVVYTEYPAIGNYSVGKNMTIDGWLNMTCPAYNTTTNGTLPASIDEVAANSTFPETIIGAHGTYTPGSAAVPAPTLNSTNEQQWGIASLVGASVYSTAAAAATDAVPTVTGMPMMSGAPSAPAMPSAAASGMPSGGVMSVISSALASGGPAGPAGPAPTLQAPSGSVSAPAARRTLGNMQEKKRWIGEW
ncbi:hypothetical protein BD324DRAFT_620334 [Kockovaella imperatae]|uniref:Uncharacterized protein n=1 Tax=Kockovaella imperatae TaxID=4999 RepID=A0A1Y1UJY5_9TREE|nr:hypothetical protein BD324DRAFT_620334 [Kockovaella imperatae]ORX38299.1 hypothetical protein BD324DRAFT_620334 [Kockovaella imperatae]